MEHRISYSTTHRIDFDLWGFTSGWIDTIQDALMNFALKNDGVHCQTTNCGACMSVLIESENLFDLERARKVYQPLANLATAHMRRKNYTSKDVYYDNP